MKIVVYGSYGYTGRLIVDELLEKGFQCRLSGRNLALLKDQATAKKLSFTVAEVGTGAFNQLIASHDILVHCAGPFMPTAVPTIEACIAGKTHYLDITGEYAVFEQAKKYSAKAEEAGIMVLPGCGFDVVPSDCLSLHLKNRLPDARDLELAFAGLGGGLSRGTSKSMVEGMGYGGKIRKDHELVKVKNAHEIREIDYGSFKSISVTIPWGDISTAYFSTGIPNIKVFTAVTQKMLRSMKLGDYLGFFFRQKWVKRFLLKKIEERPVGPSEEQRKKGKSYFWGKVSNDQGENALSRMSTPDGYTLTALTTVAIVHEIVKGNFRTGFQTPATAFGPDFILGIPGCMRMDE